ncbi:MAG: OmpA family protein [Spirochaetaceae bacterium]|nr:OmpA family protein [Spirochaetaceae bacterium]
MNKPRISKAVFFCLLLPLFSVTSLAGDEPVPFYNELSLGLGGGFSGYSPTAFSLSGMFSADYRFLPFLTLGLNAGYGSDLGRLTNAEGQLFVRWYFLRRQTPLNGMLFFAQVEGGGAGLWDNPPAGVKAGETFRGIFAAGLGAGLRLKLPANLYGEAYARAGYPYIWGLSLKIGYTLTFKPRERNEEAARPEREVPQTPAARTESSPASAQTESPNVQTSSAQPERAPASTQTEILPSQTAGIQPERRPQPANTQGENRPATIPKITLPVVSGTVVTDIFGNIIFRGNGSDFTDLDGAIVKVNNEILDNVAAFMKENPEYELRIEGYANPVQTLPLAKDMEEKRFLQPISRERARVIMELLIQRGVGRSRLTAVGLGGTKTLVPVDDPDNWEKNRRVEFTLVK